MEERYQYSAAESLLGYIYQCRLALLGSLKRLKSDASISIAIETLDDVVFEKDGSPTEIIQVKHHIARKANLTNASTDLWRTIRIWCDLFSKWPADNNSILCLMTTENSTEDSAAYYLRIENRNIAEAENLLLQTSRTSSNKSNEEGYKKFNSLSDEQRIALLNRVHILDNCPLINDIQINLKEELWGHCERHQSDQFLIYLEGWWLQRVTAILSNKKYKPLKDKRNASEISNSDKNNNTRITGREIDAELNNLREKFKSDSLPVHQEIMHAKPDITPFSNWVFVKQLRLLNLLESRIQRASTNFFKASEQRSRWVRESLLVDDELEQYDDTLIEEWSIQFDQSKDAMPLNPTDSEHVASGMRVYDWVEGKAHIPIRPSFQEHFITRGSYHMLANRLLVGWHPEFKSRLAGQYTEENS